MNTIKVKILKMIDDLQRELRALSHFREAVE